MSRIFPGTARQRVLHSHHCVRYGTELSLYRRLESGDNTHQVNGRFALIHVQGMVQVCCISVI